MTDGPVEHLSIVRTVPGWMWLLGKQLQDREKATARAEFDRHVEVENYELVSDVRETLAPDERMKAMLIEYRAEGVRR